MPIYEYRCNSCGYQDDFLQKLSEPPLTDCPECGESTFAKQVTAAGFQLKGTGWYATDFKANGTSKANAGKDNAGKESAGKESAGKESAGKDSAKGDDGAATGPKSGNADAPASGAGASSACS
jgi:putative FmdB family regulatory protein